LRHPRISTCRSAIVTAAIYPRKTFDVAVLQFAVFVAREIVELGALVGKSRRSDVESVLLATEEIAHPDLDRIGKFMFTKEWLGEGDRNKEVKIDACAMRT